MNFANGDAGSRSVAARVRRGLLAVSLGNVEVIPEIGNQRLDSAGRLCRTKKRERTADKGEQKNTIRRVRGSGSSAAANSDATLLKGETAKLTADLLNNMARNIIVRDRP